MLSKEEMKKKRSEYSKAKRLANLEDERLRARLYYAKNKEEINKRKALSRERNKESIKEGRRQYKIKNPEKFKNQHKTLNGRYDRIKSKAKQREILFELSREDFKKQFYEQPCFYCKEISTGIDRVDNNKGYIVGNMCPCCAWCNFMKLDKSRIEFEEKIIKLYQIISERS